MARARARRAAGGLALIVLAGCATASLDVPPLAPAVLSAGRELGADEATLARGREIYLDRCSRCHAPYPITGYAEERWREILPPMIESSRLDEAGGAAVTAYVTAARRALADSASTGRGGP